MSDGAQVTADHLEITGSRVGVVGATRGTTLTLTDCRIAASTEFGVKVGGGASLVVERGVLVGNKLGLFAGEGGTEVTVRGATVHGQAGPGISIGIGARGTIESSDVYENDYPGIATVGGTVHVLENRVHDNRSNGIAVRDGADAVVEGNEVWGNLLPAITVVGARTKARVRDNTVRDNTGQGIYVYQCAEAVISDNRLADNGGAAITVSDKGSTATVLRNRVERGQGAGIWVADAAKATLEANEVRGPAGPGILVNNRAIVEAVDNVVEGATCGVLVNAAGGVFTRNRLLGNAAGSWLLIDQTRFEKDGDDEDALPVPAWTVAHLDPAKYPAFAYRVGLEVGVEPRRVGELASALALLDLATRLDAQPPAAWSTLIHEHVEAERLAHGGASAGRQGRGDREFAGRARAHRRPPRGGRSGRRRPPEPANAEFPGSSRRSRSRVRLARERPSRAGRAWVPSTSSSSWASGTSGSGFACPTCPARSSRTRAGIPHRGPLFGLGCASPPGRLVSAGPRVVRRACPRGQCRATHRGPGRGHLDPLPAAGARRWCRGCLAHCNVEASPGPCLAQPRSRQPLRDRVRSRRRGDERAGSGGSGHAPRAPARARRADPRGVGD